jgi:exonuclease III
MLKILSWNIRQGGGTRVVHICDRLERFGAQIVVLSEFRNNKSGDLIRRKLLKAGYKFQNISGSSGNSNSVAIFSKVECIHHLYPDSDPIYSHNIISSEYEAFTLFGMYLPHKKKHVIFDFLIKEAKKGHSGIMVGDYNTGKNYIDQVGDSFWYSDKLTELEAENYTDAFRFKYGNVKEYSWYSHHKNGYRYDHTYVHETILPVVTDCYYLHEWREEKLSDHSPMVLELG